MMDDRELLERAARAAGFTPCGWLDFTGLTDWHGAESGIEVEEIGGPWNPLEDDGDAFRLMQALRLDISHGENVLGEGLITVLNEVSYWDEAPTCEEYDIAGFRRAIVRAAAAMEAP